MPSSLRSVNGGYSTISGAEPPIAHFEEADSQTYKDGDLVIFSSSKVAIAVADGNNLDTDGAKILGIVCRDGRNGTSPGQVPGKPTVRDVPVKLATADVLVRLPLWASAAGDAQYSDFEPGSACVLRNVGGIFVAAIATTTKPVLKLVRKEPEIADGETYYWGLFQIIHREF